MSAPPLAPTALTPTPAEMTSAITASKGPLPASAPSTSAGESSSVAIWLFTP